MDAARGLPKPPAVPLQAVVLILAVLTACQSPRPAAHLSPPKPADTATTAPVLHDASPKAAGFDPERLQYAADLLDTAVSDRVTPSAVLLVARRGVVVLERAAGHQTYDEGSPAVTPSTIYDLASLTKIIATTTLMMRRVEAGELDLDAAAASYLPELKESPVGGATLRDLLAHSSGLPCCTELFRDVGEGLDRGEARARYLEHIAGTELEVGRRERAIYSDLGVLLLGEILERSSDRSLAVQVQDEVLEPLGLADTGYLPLEDLRERIAATEFDSWRGRLPHGEVHDENTLALGGIAPHAGLFGTARDVAAFGQTILNGGVYGEQRLANAKTVSLFTRRAELVPRQQPRARLGHAVQPQFRRPLLLVPLLRPHRLHRDLSLDRPGTRSDRRPADEPCPPDPGQHRDQKTPPGDPRRGRPGHRRPRDRTASPLLAPIHASHRHRPVRPGRRPERPVHAKAKSDETAALRSHAAASRPPRAYTRNPPIHDLCGPPRCRLAFPPSL